MPDRRIPSLAELPHRLREQIEQLPGHYRALCQSVRDDPGRLWYNPLARIILWVTVGVVAIWATHWFVGSLVSEYARDRVEAPPTATLFVICTNPDCAAQYTVTRDLDFDDWPLTCQECGLETAYRATRCPEIRGWVPEIPGRQVECPPRERAPDKPVPEHRPRPDASSDDDEDGW